MANRRLTQRLIDTLAPGTSACGFEAWTLPSCRGRFFLRAQCNGKRTWTRIGDAGAMPLAAARDFARSHLAGSRTGGSSRSAEIAAETPSFAGSPDAGSRKRLTSVAVT